MTFKLDKVFITMLQPEGLLLSLQIIPYSRLRAETTLFAPYDLDIRLINPSVAFRSCCVASVAMLLELHIGRCDRKMPYRKVPTVV